MEIAYDKKYEVNEDLISLVDRIITTEKFYSKSKVNNNKLIEDARNIEYLEKDTSILQIIERAMIGLENLKTSNGFIRGKSSTKDLINTIKESKQIKKQKAIQNLEKRLTGLHLMSEDYYEAIKNKKDNLYDQQIYSAVVEYNEKAPFRITDTKIKDYKKKATSIIKYEQSSKILSPNSNPENKVYLVTNNEGKKERSNLVEAGIYNSKKTKIEPLLNTIKIELDKSPESSSLNVNEYFKQQILDELSMINKASYPDVKEQDKESLKGMIEKKANYEKTIFQLEKIKGIIEQKIFDFETKSQIITKINAEKVALEEEKQDIINKIEQYKKDLKSRETSQQKTEKIISNYEQKKQREQRKIINKFDDEEKKERKTDKQKEKDELLRIREIIDSVRENITLVDVEKYVRDNNIAYSLSLLNEQLIEDYKKQLINKKVQEELVKEGISLQKLVNADKKISNFEEQKHLKKILEECKLRLGSSEEMFTMNNNGFTNLEQAFEELLNQKKTLSSTSDELRKEIDFLLSKFDKIREASAGMQGELKIFAANEARKKVYVNTVLESELMYINSSEIKKEGKTR